MIAVFFFSVLAYPIAGCGQLSVQPELRSGVFSTDTLTNDDAVLNHIRRLNATEMGGRFTGSLGFARAAVYASDHFASAGLASLEQKEYRSLYTTNIRTANDVSLVRLDADSTRLDLQNGLLWSDLSFSGVVRFQQIVRQPAQNVEVSGYAVVLPADQATREKLLDLVRRGAKAVLIVGTAELNIDREPVEGVVVAASISSEALETFLGVRLIVNQPARLPFEIEFSSVSSKQTTHSALNISGLLPGANPNLRNELVILAAPLDGFGTNGGHQFTDGSDLALGAAAVLESARILAGLQRLRKPLDRSVLFVLWSGSKTGNAGVRSFLNQPPWPASAIHSIIYLTDTEIAPLALENIFQDTGLDLEIISAAAGRPDSRLAERRDWIQNHSVLSASLDLMEGAITAVRKAATWK